MNSFSSWLFSIASIPFLLIGVIGNILVIRIVHKTPDMHSVTNYLLANLAVSDVMAILVMWPWMLCNTNGFVKKMENYCWISVFLYINVVVSSVTLTVLAVERYHALLKPLRSGLRLTTGKVKKNIAVIWIFGVIISLPCVFQKYKAREIQFCFVTSKAFFFLFSVVIIYLPSAVFIFCYGSLIKGLYFDNTICVMDAEIQDDRTTEKKKLVITFLLATVNFIAGYGPTAIFESLVHTGAIRENIVVETILCFLCFCSPCLNPVLYAFRSTSFQQGFKRIIFCCEPQSQTAVDWLLQLNT